MTWLYGQTSLWYLIAFVVGVLLAWLLLVLPQQRRLSRLRARRPSETGAAGARAWSGPAADPDPPAGPDRSDAEPIPAGADGTEQRTRGDDAAAERFRPVDPALSVLDAETIGSRSAAPAGGPAARTVGAADMLPAKAERSGDNDNDGNRSGAAADPARSDRPGARPDPARPAATREPEQTEPTGAGSGAARAGGPGHGVPAVAPGPWPGSALPAPDGSAPAEAFTIKGNAGSMLYHTPASPYYSRTRAEAWFSSTEDAEAAGFIAWKRR